MEGASLYQTGEFARWEDVARGALFFGVAGGKGLLTPLASVSPRLATTATAVDGVVVGVGEKVLRGSGSVAVQRAAGITTASLSSSGAA